jgi:hypothetical protein
VTAPEPSHAERLALRVFDTNDHAPESLQARITTVLCEQSTLHPEDRAELILSIVNGSRPYEETEDIPW